MLTCSYRSLEPVVHQRLAELDARRVASEPLVLRVRRVAAHRMARAFAGGVAATGAVVAALLALASFTGAPPWENDARRVATLLLLGSWVLGGAVLVASRTVAARRIAAELDAPLRLTGDAAADLARLAASDPIERSVALARRWERAGAALPMVAACFLAPLTLHFAVWLVVSQPAGAGAIDAFGSWIGLSALLVGHAHLAVAAAAVRWVWSLRSLSPEAMLLRPSGPWGSALLVGIGVACIPGVCLIAIPPILVGVTGIVFLPSLFGATARVMAEERALLDAA